MLSRLTTFPLILLLLGGCAAPSMDQGEVDRMNERIAALESEVAELKEILQSQNELLRGIASEAQERFRTVSDKARIGAAKAELANIKQGLGMFQAESDDSAYPRTAMINSYEDLRVIISPYVRITPSEAEASFVFISYSSPAPDEFVLKAGARDRDRTVITVTPRTITP